MMKDFVFFFISLRFFFFSFFLACVCSGLGLRAVFFGAAIALQFFAFDYFKAMLKVCVLRSAYSIVLRSNMPLFRKSNAIMS